MNDVKTCECGNIHNVMTTCKACGTKQFEAIKTNCPWYDEEFDKCIAVDHICHIDNCAPYHFVKNR